MECQAYPADKPAGRKGFRTLLQIQNMLHRTDSVVLPITMLVLAGSYPAYQYYHDADTSRLSVWNFLIKIMLQMVPLVVLECKILKCADPVGLFAKCSTKVVLMHFIFFALRVSTALFVKVQDHHKRFHTFSVVMCAVSALLLPTVFGFRPTPRGLWKHADVFLLALSAAAVAAAEVYSFAHPFFRKAFRLQLMEDMVVTGANYVEILAFVPAVWMAFRRTDAGKEPADSDVAVARKRALGLFALMTLIYTVEDVYYAVEAWRDYRVAAFAHLTHYALVLDFAAFILVHLWDSEKLRLLTGSVMSWLADRYANAV